MKNQNTKVLMVLLSLLFFVSCSSSDGDSLIGGIDNEQSIIGLVVDQKDVPISGAFIKLYKSSASLEQAHSLYKKINDSAEEVHSGSLIDSVNTGADGTFKITAIELGNHFLTISVDGFKLKVIENVNIESMEESLNLGTVSFTDEDILGDDEDPTIIIESSSKGNSSSSYRDENPNEETSSSTKETSSSSYTYTGEIGFKGAFGKLKHSSLKTVKIGTQTWLAQNLFAPYLTHGGDLEKGEDDYGKWKDWTTNTDGVGQNGYYYSYSGATKSNVNGIDLCPIASHLPSIEEWETLFEFIRTDNNIPKDPNGSLQNEMQFLRSSEGWKDIPANNKYGFSAVPSGAYVSEGYYLGKWLGAGSYAYFWSSTKIKDSIDAYAISMGPHSSSIISKIVSLYNYSIRCIADPEPKANSGTFVDSRDQQEYKWIQVGQKKWMAENLNYKTPLSKCFEDKDENCIKNGQLYNWTTAMDIDSSFIKGDWDHNELEESSQGICPEGWRMPSSDNVWELENYIGGQLGFDASEDGSDVLKANSLKSINDSWNVDNLETDQFGFNLLKSGFRDDWNQWDSTGAGFWTSTESWGINSIKVYMFRIKETSNSFKGSVGLEQYKSDLFSVRCIESKQ